VVASETFEIDAQDFRTQLTRIRQKSPEAIFIVAYKEAILILRQIKELGIKTKLLSTPVFEDNEILEKAKETAEGVIYVYYGGFDPKSENEKTKMFVDVFKKKYNRDPGYFSALAYDATNIVLLAIEKGGPHSEDIKDALYQIKDFPGVTGMTTFDANGDVQKPVTLKIVKKGKFQAYQE
jgi:branched-chain amino acid transport system substrate-binding protein